jgi:tRNA(fMet)-specific endonuclease VapC
MPVSESTPTPPMISTSVVLDTNVAIDFINQPERSFGRVAPTARLFVPIIVAGELFFGARNSRRVERNIANVEQFCSVVKVLVIDFGISRWYGDIKAALRGAGTMIPENDIWIAATAVTHGLPLVTLDDHFKAIPEVRLVAW